MENLFAPDMAGDGGVEYHEKRRYGHSDDVEQREQTALVAEVKINIGRAYAADDETVADLLNEENEADPKKLIVAGDGRPYLFEADGRRVGVIASFAHSENGEAEKQRSYYANDERDAPVCNGRAAAQRHIADREHRDEHARKSAADAGKEGRTRGKLVSRVGVCRESGHHAPVGNVMHRVGYRVHEIDDAEEPHKVPSLKIGVEGKIHDDARREHTDDECAL